MNETSHRIPQHKRIPPELCAAFLAWALADSTGRLHRLRRISRPGERDFEEGILVGARNTAVQSLICLFKHCHGYNRARLAHIVRDSIHDALENLNHK